MPSAFSSLAPLGKNSATRFLVFRLQLCALDKVHRHGISNFDEEWYGKDKHLHTLILAPVFSNLNFGYDIGHFGRYHNTLCLSPQILHKHCFQFFLGLTMVPRENWKDNAYAKFGGNEQSVLWYFLKWPIQYNRQASTLPFRAHDKLCLNTEYLPLVSLYKLLLLLFHNSAVSYLQALCAKLRFGFHQSNFRTKGSLIDGNQNAVWPFALENEFRRIMKNAVILSRTSAE